MTAVMDVDRPTHQRDIAGRAGGVRDRALRTDLGFALPRGAIGIRAGASHESSSLSATSAGPHPGDNPNVQTELHY